MSGSAFQIFMAATGKARLPIVDSLEEDTARWLVSVDGSVHICDISAVRVSGPRYCDAVPFKTFHG